MTVVRAKLKPGAADLQVELPPGHRLNVKDIELRTHLARWRKTRHPVYLWRAILVCDERGKLPLEVWAYLRRVAQDMAAPGKDTRGALPTILGFPKKGKRGPRPRDPGPKDLNDVKLVLLFGREVLKSGCTVDEALVAVLNSLPQRSADALIGDSYDKLKNRIAEAAGLTAVPPTADAWRQALRALPLLPLYPFARQIVGLRATMFREIPV
jgi:hypothetical protein